MTAVSSFRGSTGPHPRSTHALVVASGWTACALLLTTMVGVAQQLPSPLPTTKVSMTGTPVAPTPVLASSNRRSDRPVLPAAAQAQIAAAIGKDDPGYHATPEGDGFRMAAPNNTIAASFSAEGVEFSHGASRWRMTLRGYGYSQGIRPMPAARPTGTLNRVEYRRGALTEWYVNGPFGLQQGFTIQEPPGASQGQPLALAFALSGNVTASIEADARGLTLHNPDGPPLTYGGLSAWDADQRELPAWLEVTGNELRLHVDDANARYPLTIDPYVEARKLTSLLAANGGVYDDGNEYDHVGRSVSMSADGTTIVVGVPGKESYWYGVGAAYVFLRPDPNQGGWSAPSPVYLATKLMRSDGIYYGSGPAPISGRFGASVSTNADGSTIVVGDPDYRFGLGRAFVFVRPATAGGWRDALVRTESAWLQPSYVNSGQRFGASVAISGDGTTVAVGAPNKCTNWILFCDPGAGAALVFVRPPHGWSNAIENAELRASFAPSPHGLGRHVSVSHDGSTVAASARGHISVFVRPTTWAATLASATLTSTPIASSFPRAMAMSSDGGTIVGTLVTGWNYQEQTAQVFERTAAGWTDVPPTAKLYRSGARLAETFGESVATSADGRRIIVTLSSDYRPGKAYVFARPLAGWNDAYARFVVEESGYSYGQGFGLAAAVNADGTEFVVGSPFLTVNDNFAQGAAFVYVGPKEAPMVSISPSQLAFGDQLIGTTSMTQVFTVANVGEDPVDIFDVTVSSQAAHFTTTQNCVSASPLQAGGSCTEEVRFAPVSAGLINSGIFVNSTANLCCISATGTGIKIDTAISVSVPSGPAVVGQPVAVNFSITPAISTTFIPQGTVTVQADTGESCTADVAAGACVLVFTTPMVRTINGSYSGDARFNGSTSPDGLLLVADFSLALSPASQTINGRKATFTVVVDGQSGFVGDVALTCSGGPQGTTCGISPAVVSVSGASALAKATITLPPGTAPGAYTLTFSGTSGGATRSATGILIVGQVSPGRR